MRESAHEVAVQLLGRLVRCPSVNPAGGGGDGPPVPPYGEARLTDLLADLLRGWGAVVERREVSPGRENLLARWDGRDRSLSFMMECHSDTVPPAPGSPDPYSGAVRDGRLYGRGACDDKGPMAAMLLGIRAALDAEPVPPITLWFVATCDEESGAGGARALMADGFRPTAAVVGEPTQLRVLLAHKGAARWRLTTRGLAAHSSMPERGRNAIVTMARAIARLEEVVGPALAARRHPDLGSPTLSVGTVRGGTQVNVVPDRCEAEIDRRLLPGESADAAAAELERALAPLREGDAGFHAELVPTQAFPPYAEDRESAIVRIVADACRGERGASEFWHAPWATNAGVFKAAGVPCTVFGPGSDAQAHVVDEYIEIDQVVIASRIYAEIVRDSGAL